MIGFIFRPLVFLFLVMTVFISYDVSQHGLDSSETGKFLKSAGLLHHVKYYSAFLERKIIEGIKWYNKNAPTWSEIKARSELFYSIYLAKIVPYSKLAYAKLLIGYDIVLSYIPPDLSEKIIHGIWVIIAVVTDVFVTITDFVCKTVEQFMQFLVKNDIVGENWKQKVEDSFSQFSTMADSYWLRIKQFYGLN